MLKINATPKFAVLDLPSGSLGSIKHILAKTSHLMSDMHSGSEEPPGEGEERCKPSEQGVRRQDGEYRYSALGINGYLMTR